MGLSELPVTLGNVCVGPSQDLVDGANTTPLSPLIEADQFLTSSCT